MTTGVRHEPRANQRGRRPPGRVVEPIASGMSRTVWAWARPAAAATTLAVVVWRLGAGPFRDGVGAVVVRTDGRADA